MKRAFMRLISFLLLAGLLISGCTKSAVLEITKPAEYNLSDLKRLAVFDFNGPRDTGGVVADKFTGQLWGTGYFSMLERKELQKVLEEHALQMSGVIDDSTIVEFGKILGVDGMVVGSVTAYRSEDKRGKEKVKEKVWKGEYEKDEKGNFIYERVGGKEVKKKKYVEELVDKEYINREAVVGLSFRLVSIETAEIRASGSQTQTFSQKYYPQSDRMPAKEALLSDLTDQVIRKFIPTMAPYKVTVSRKFEKGNDQVNAGIELAQNNLWDKATEVWEKETHLNPQNPAAFYNLGIAYEATGDLDRAEQAFESALKIRVKDLYMKALAQIRQRKVDQEKLEQQLNREQAK
jgi:tetratricopeptide (TPR) repeat protein